MIVPAGTELKVDLDEHKIIVPVRVGFATAIPALTEVAVALKRSYVDVPSRESGTGDASPIYLNYVEYATLTALTVDGKKYEVQTNSLPLSRGGTHNEVTFTLGSPVKILR